MSQQRVHAGSGPRGGQFAAASRSEAAGVHLDTAGAEQPLSRDELDAVSRRILATFRGDQAAHEAVQLLRELSRTYLGGGR